MSDDLSPTFSIYDSVLVVCPMRIPSMAIYIPGEGEDPSLYGPPKVVGSEYVSTELWNKAWNKADDSGKARQFPIKVVPHDISQGHQLGLQGLDSQHMPIRRGTTCSADGKRQARS